MRKITLETSSDFDMNVLQEATLKSEPQDLDIAQIWDMLFGALTNVATEINEYETEDERSKRTQIYAREIIKLYIKYCKECSQSEGIFGKD